MDYKVGDSVVIVKAEGYTMGSTRIPLKDPYPEHLGKVGVIQSLDDTMPHIVLEDGTELDGCECWWRKLANE